MTIDGKEFPVSGVVYSDTDALLQKSFPDGFARDGESTHDIYARWISTELRNRIKLPVDDIEG